MQREILYNEEPIDSARQEKQPEKKIITNWLSFESEKSKNLFVGQSGISMLNRYSLKRG